MHNNVIETRAKIYEVSSSALVVLVSLVNQDIMKFDATRSGIRMIKQTITYHQWRYSFKKRKKYHVKSTTVTMTVNIPITMVPHLRGKHPQHV